MQTDKKVEKKEEQTKYGEFVSSTFHWVPKEKQKDRAAELEKITKDKK